MGLASMKCVAHRGVYLGEIQLQDIRTTEGSTYELEFYTIAAAPVHDASTMSTARPLK